MRLLDDDPEGRASGMSTGYADDELLVVHPEEPGEGAVVLLRRHVGGLGDLPAPDLGCMLAALRRAARWAEQRGVVSNPRLEELRTHPGSKGHLCFRVGSRRPLRPSPR